MILVDVQVGFLVHLVSAEVLGKLRVLVNLPHVADNVTGCLLGAHLGMSAGGLLFLLPCLLVAN